MLPIRSGPWVSTDVDDAVGWYESKRNGLGLEFLDELDGLLVRVGRTPHPFPVIQGDVRRGSLHRFP